MTTYQVLARKWRPRKLSEVVEQTNIVKALSYAFDNKRIHHAYLLTGPHGTGKTSIGRIIAKSLNCEKGVSAEPCLTCSICQSIEKGQFVDLLEVDAASRTRVEDTRDLLDNIQYMPTTGRYKIYLIDEVHMLSQHSFNALLKSLEEPPSHVIFILATTELKKIPATLLSRCLQFYLRPISSENMINHLEHILQTEQCKFEKMALFNISKVVRGSMRDALSLLDQLIALGEGNVSEQASFSILGTVHTEQILALLEMIAENQTGSCIKTIQSWAALGVDFHAVMDQLLEQLHIISIQQVVDNHTLLTTYSDSVKRKLIDISYAFSKEQIQLYYEIAILGKQNIKYAPSEQMGFEITIIRMLAFTSVETIKSPLESSQPPISSSSKSKNDEPVKKNQGTYQDNPFPLENKSDLQSLSKFEENKFLHHSNLLDPNNIENNAPSKEKTEHVDKKLHKNQSDKTSSTTKNECEKNPKNHVYDQTSWKDAVKNLSLTGPSKLLASECYFLTYEAGTLTLGLSNNFAPILTKISEENLVKSLCDYDKEIICVNINVLESSDGCSTQNSKIEENHHNESLEQLVETSSNLQEVLQRFGGLIKSTSVRNDFNQENTNESQY